MPLGVQFTQDAAERIVAATAKVEQGNVGSGSAVLPKNDIHLRGTENWCWGKITSDPDDDGLSSWKAQRFKADGTFEDDPLQSEFDHNAFEVNGAAGNGQYCRMMYVGGSSAEWVFAVGGGGGALILFDLDSGFTSGTTTVSVTVNARSAGAGVEINDSVDVINNLNYSGSSGQKGMAWKDDQGVWHLFAPVCAAGGGG